MYTTKRKGDQTSYAKKGQLIKVKYQIENLEGEVLESSLLNQKPLVFQVGDQQIMTSFQKYLREMSIGQIISYKEKEEIITIELLGIM